MAPDFLAIRGTYARSAIRGLDREKAGRLVAPAFEIKSDQQLQHQLAANDPGQADHA